MPKFHRSIVTYDPVRDLAVRWPAWTIEEKRLTAGAEWFLLDHCIAVVDVEKWGGDRDRAWAHVIAHLDSGHHLDEGPVWLAGHQEQIANWLAALRLDRLEDRAWVSQQ